MICRPKTNLSWKERVRQKAVVTLKSLLRESTAATPDPEIPMRRLNRFQYNNAVRDLFDLNMDVFHLPEKLMSRDQNYVATGKQAMPAKVSVSSKALQESGGMMAVNSFPKDLRASHGFDNQANQLTLSPLLLERILAVECINHRKPRFQ